MHALIQSVLGRKKDDARENAPERRSGAHVTPASATFVRFSMSEQVLFAKRLSFLVKAGVSLHEGLVMIKNQTRSKRKQAIFQTLIDKVSAGQYLSSSLDTYRHLFGEFTINIIKVGEHTGALAENLRYLAEELEKRHALRRKVLGALVYPLFITVATLGVTSMLVVFIFPKIMPIFTSLNVTLPFTTRALLAVSNYLSDWGLLTLLGLILAFFLYHALRRWWRAFRKVTDWVLINLPIAGSIARAYNAANFCRTLRLTVNAGIGLTEGLHITAQVTKNTLYKDAYEDIAQYVVRGETISSAMTKHTHIFPDILPQMILIGETTGSLSQTLGYLSDLYETEVDEGTKNLSNSIEPILLMTMGILVGLIAVSVITPIYDVTRHLQGT
jgi:type IV pilus assembly protein PilC